MTARFRRCAKCPDCGREIPLEDEMSHWVRTQPELDSASGLVVMDKDLTFHRYKTSLGRDFQLIMFVEVKTHGKELTATQRDTMHLLNQVLRNDQRTPTKEIRMHLGNTPRRAHSSLTNKHVNLKALGFHLLWMSGATPDDSKEIIWDKKPITRDTLVKVLRFDLNPISLREMDFRSHHVKHIQPEFAL